MSNPQYAGVTLAPKKVLTGYFFGGGGMNLASSFEVIRSKNKNDLIGDFQAEYRFACYDTSSANFSAKIPRENVYLPQGIEKSEGGGGQRNKNADIHKEHIPLFLQQFPPGDVCFVASTWCGSTGGTSSQMAVNELLKLGKTVVVFGIGSSIEGQDCTNTLLTISLYEKIVSKHKRSLVTMYRENSLDTAARTVDDEILTGISSLLLLCSGRTREADINDIRNIFNYDQVTSYPADLASFELTQEPAVEDRRRPVIAAVTLTSPKCGISLLPLAYHVNAFVPDEVWGSATADGLPPVHYCVRTHDFHEVAARLNSRLEKLQQEAESLSRTVKPIACNVKTDDFDIFG